VPIPVQHAAQETLGYLFEAGGRTVCYIPDCYELPQAATEQLRGIDVMILDALRHRPHKTHMTLSDSVVELQKIKASRSYIIHMCHDLDHDETRNSLPTGIDVSYDGLTIKV